MNSRLAHRVRLAAVSSLAVIALGLTGCSGGSEDGGGDGEVNTIDAGVAESINAAVEAAMQYSGSTEAIVGVWTADGDYVHGYGDVTGGARFRGAQSTQPMVCALLLDAVERGEVQFDEKIRDQLPRLTGIDDVTYEQLCTMRSGIADFKGPLVDINFNNPTRFWSEQELIAQGFARSPTAWPGLNYNRSDTNAVILGRALRVDSGQTLSEQLATHIFEPAEMTKTYFPDPNSLEIAGDSMSSITYPASGGNAVCEAGTIELAEVSPSMLQGAGGVITTAADLKRFYEHYFAGDFGGEGSRELVLNAVSTANPERDENGEPTTEVAEPGPADTLWAFGTEKVGPLYGMPGRITGTSSAAYHDPESGYTVVVALNNASAGMTLAKNLALQIAALSSGQELPWTAEDKGAAIAEAAICQEAPAEEAPAEG